MLGLGCCGISLWWNLLNNSGQGTKRQREALQDRRGKEPEVGSKTPGAIPQFFKDHRFPLPWGHPEEIGTSVHRPAICLRTVCWLHHRRSDSNNVLHLMRRFYSQCKHVSGSELLPPTSLQKAGPWYSREVHIWDRDLTRKATGGQ